MVERMLMVVKWRAEIGMEKKSSGMWKGKVHVYRKVRRSLNIEPSKSLRHSIRSTYTL
jgi:hypothetical protein